MSTKTEILTHLKKWYQAWNNHDLDEVMDLFHEDVLFVNWEGKSVKGKRSLRKAWNKWFKNHNGFQFDEIETFVDEASQKALFRWNLKWTPESNDGEFETREGVDVLHFEDGKIIKKLVFTGVFSDSDL